MKHLSRQVSQHQHSDYLSSLQIILFDLRRPEPALCKRTLHTGRPGGTKSNLIFTKQKILMIDFLMSALRRHLRSVVISPIGEGKVVVLDISCFGPWRAFSMTDQAGNIWVLSCETENIST